MISERICQLIRHQIPDTGKKIAQTITVQIENVLNNDTASPNGTILLPQYEKYANPNVRIPRKIIKNHHFYHYQNDSYTFWYKLQ